MPGYETLTATDANFLYWESQTTPMNMGNVCIFEGEPFFDESGAFRLGEVRRAFESRLHLVPRYRKKVMEVPFGLGHPVLVDDPAFDIANHVRLISLPNPGTEEQLKEAFAAAHEGMIPRSKPLWEITFVEGIEGNRVGMIQKVHHSLIDGVSSVDVMTTLLDSTPEYEPAEPQPWEAEPLPDPSVLTAELFQRQLTQFVPPFGLAGVGASGTAATLAQEQMQDLMQGFSSMMELGPLARTSLNAPVGPHRRFDWIRTTLDEVKGLRQLAEGATVNDVMLAAVGAGVRELLASRGEDVDNLSLRVFVPVSLRAEGDRAMAGNRVSGFIAPLHVDEPDVVRRLGLIQQATKRLKESKQAVGIHALTKLQDFAPPTLLALAGRQTVQQSSFAHLTVTNVPGPPHEIYLLGARLLELHPMVLIANTMTVNIAVQSLAGRLSIGLCADRDRLPDLDVLKGGIEQALADMRKAAKRRVKKQPATV
jgi:WS/DGAT/MGAT family acyltransferase